MTPNSKFYERNAILAAISPVSQGAGTATSGWVPVSAFHQIVAIMQSGVLGTAATYDAKFQQATDNSGTSAKDITGKSITQIVKASGDNKQAILELRPEDLDSTNGFTHVQLSITVGAAASLVSAVVIGALARFEPASAFNPTSVVQTVG